MPKMAMITPSSFKIQLQYHRLSYFLVYLQFFHLDFFSLQSMDSRWAWMQLASYAALAAFAFSGIALAYFDFGHDSLKPLPDPPKNKTTVIHNAYYGADRVDMSVEYAKYIRQNHWYVNYANDPRIFVLIPSFVAAVIAIVMLLAGICSRQIFSTTVSLYSSFGMFALTIGYIIFYQIRFSIVHPFTDAGIQTYFMISYKAVTSYHLAMAVYLVLQMILAGKELRTQKTGWPTFNFSNIFTVNTVMLIANMTAGVNTLISVYNFDSVLLDGLRLFGANWDDPRTKFPIYYALPCLTAGVFGLVVNTEAVLSHIFGHSHSKLAGIFGLCSAVCYGAMAVFVSPGFVRVALGPYKVYPWPMFWSIIMTVLSFIYTFACFLCPCFLTTPPVFVTEFLKTFTGLTSEATSASDNINKDAPTTAMDKIRKNIEQLEKSMQGVKHPLCSMGVLILSNLAIIRIMGSSWGRPWTNSMLIAGHVAIINRVLPKVVAEVSRGVATKEPGLQVLMNFLIETVLLISSAIGSFSSANILSALLNIPLIIYEFLRIKSNQSLKAGIAALAVPRPDDGDDVQQLKENEELSVTHDEDVKSPKALA